MATYKIHLDINYVLATVEASPDFSNKNRVILDTFPVLDAINKNVQKNLQEIIVPLDVCSISSDKILLDEVTSTDKYINNFIKNNFETIDCADAHVLNVTKNMLEEITNTDVCSKTITKPLLSEITIGDNMQIIMYEIASLSLNTYTLNSQPLN